MSNDEVGYRRPPRHSQFKPGQSGNPKGRRKHIRNIANDIDEELREPITIRENGRERKISKQRAFVKSLVAAAIKGDVRAINAVVNYSRTLVGVPQENLDESVEDLHILKSYVEREVRRREGKEGMQTSKKKTSKTTN